MLQTRLCRPLHRDVPRHRYGHDPDWLQGVHPAAVTPTGPSNPKAAGTHDETGLNGGHGPHCSARRAPPGTRRGGTRNPRAPSATRPSSTACARTTAPGCASTAPRRKPTGPRAARSAVRCWLLVSTGDDVDIHGDHEAIWRPWTAGELLSRAIHSGHHQAEQARTS